MYEKCTIGISSNSEWKSPTPKRFIPQSIVTINTPLYIKFHENLSRLYEARW